MSQEDTVEIKITQLKSKVLEIGDSVVRVEGIATITDLNKSGAYSCSLIEILYDSGATTKVTFRTSSEKKEAIDKLKEAMNQ